MARSPATPHRWVAVIVVAFGALGLFAAPAGALIVNQPSGKRLSVAPRAGVDAASIPGSMASRGALQATPFDTHGNVTYNGGPVMHGANAYAFYWDPAGAFTGSTKALINRYFTDLAADSGTNANNYSVMQQYYDTTGYVANTQSFAGALVDSNAYPSSTCSTGGATGATVCLEDHQIVNELNSYISAHSLPKGLGTEYFVFTPANVRTCLDAPDAGQCSDNSYCAYHSFSGSGANTLLYADDPFTFAYDPAGDPGSVKSCQFDGHSAIQEPNANIADVILTSVGHEQRESMSDPLLSAWFDATERELDDKCNGSGADPNAFLPTLGGSAAAGTLFDQIYNGDHYYSQSEWSNGQTACRMAPGAGTIAPSFAAPTAASTGQPLSFAGSATSTNAISSYSWAFGDGTRALGQSVSHAFSADGIHDVTLTVADVFGNATAVTHQVMTGPGPTAAYTATPVSAPAGSTVAFDATSSTEGSSAISSYDWDFGDGSAHGSGVTPSHSYSAPGNYTVTLTVTDASALTAAISHRVSATARPPVARFAVAPGVARMGTPVALNAGDSSGPDANIMAYGWSFGDGSAHGAGASLSHIYAAAGTYTIELAVVDTNMLVGTASQKVTILAAPQPSSAFSFGKLKLNATTGKATLSLTVAGPGTLALAGNGVVRAVKATAAGTARLVIAAQGKSRRRLQRRGHVTLSARVTFTPTGGAARTRTKTVRLVKRRK